jgi:RNA polymerase sigma factor (sigma-70 family)
MNRVLRLLRAAAGSDRDLLDRYARDRDDEAFEALVRRYGAGVWAACVRLVGRDAEDAFQAVFLTLARKAGAVTGSLPAWLHAVTRRVAANLRRNARRRSEVEAAVRPPESATEDIRLREGLALLDDELARLPEQYQAVLIVCCLEGRSRDEAAAQLGWSEGQVKGRLQRARDMLRTRLLRRGVELGGVLLAAAVAGPAPAAGRQSPAIVSLTNGVLRDMAIHEFKTWAAFLVAVVAGVGVLLADAPGDGQPLSPARAANQPAQVVTAVRPNPAVQDLSAALGVTWWEFDLPKGSRRVEIGMREDGRFTRIERYDLRAGADVPGSLKIAYQEDGAGFKLTVITRGGTLRTRGDRPGDMMRVHSTTERNGEYLELANFKQPMEVGWKHALVIKVVDTAD